MAIKDWMTLKEGGTLALERALVAFDMFVLHGRKGDPNEVCRKHLEALVNSH